MELNGKELVAQLQTCRIRQLERQNMKLLAVVQEMQDAWGYISEYDVPLGLKERIDAVIAECKGEST